MQTQRPRVRSAERTQKKPFRPYRLDHCLVLLHLHGGPECERGPALQPIPRMRCPLRSAYSAASADGSTETKVRPFSPLWNFTLPSVVAKMV